MSSYVKVTIIGHLGSEPAQKFLPSGDAVTEFSLAHSERRKDGSDAPTTWYRCTVYGKQAEVASLYLHKGAQTYVEGALLPREYEDKDGKTRTSLDVRVRELKLLGTRADGQDNRSAVLPGDADADNLPF